MLVKTTDGLNKEHREINDWVELLGSHHIIGSLEVNVLPAIYINFLDDLAPCIGGTRSYTTLNISSNYLPPLRAHLSFYDFDGNIEKYDLILKSTEAKAQENNESVKQNVYFYSIRAEKVGVYKIDNISIDSGKYAPINKPGSFVAVPSCPSGLITVQDATQDYVNSGDALTCVGSKLAFDVRLFGAPPFEIECLKMEGSSKKIIPMSVGNLQGPTITDNRYFDNQDPGSNNEKIYRLIQDLKVIETSVSIEILMDEPVNYYFQLLKVTDATNSTVIYNTDFDIHYPNRVPDTPKSVRASVAGDYISVTASALPTASFPETKNLKLYSSSGDDQEVIPLDLTGTPPWQITYSIAKSESEALKEIFTFTETIENIQTSRASITAKVPGTYVLTSVRDKYCDGILNINRISTVTLSLPPTLSVKTTQIFEKCSGARGIILDLSLTGEPHFILEYEETHLETHKKLLHVLNIKKRHESLTLKPDVEGTYEYKFLRLSDKAFTRGVVLNDLTFKQVINVPVTASLVSQKHTICPGGEVVIPVHVIGSTDYSITYAISKGSYTKKYNISGNSPNTEIVINSLETPGLYIVDIISVTDSNGCEGHVTGEPVTVEIASSLPKASIRGEQTDYIVIGGTKDIHIQTSGGGDFKVEILHEETNDIGVATGTDIIIYRVSQPGTYVIKTVRNSYCEGTPVHPTSVKILSIAKPSVSLISDKTIRQENPNIMAYSVDGVCSGAVRKLGFEFSGLHPFYLRYIHSVAPYNRFLKDVNTDGLNEEHVEMLRYLFDNSEQTTSDKQPHLNEVETQQKTAYITLNTRSSGIHTYHVYPAADKNYPHISKDVDKDTQVILSITQEVFSKPKAIFLDKKKKTYQCIFNESKTSLLLGFNGIPPFSFIISVQRDSGSITYQELVSENYIYEYQPAPPDTVGTYKHSLHFIKDATGCETVIDQNSTGSVVYRQIIGIAGIQPALSTGEVCRGDVIPFALEGTPPFTINYSMNGKEMAPIVVAEPLLTICPIKSGVLKIDKICNSLGCCSEPKPGISITVHELPSITIGDGSNEHSEMHEGNTAEVECKLTGVPPFSFRYTVAPFKEGTLRHSADPNEDAVTKSVLVTDIMEHYIKLEASSRGKYNVVMVKDAHCQYPPISKPSLCRESNNLSNM